MKDGDLRYIIEYGKKGGLTFLLKRGQRTYQLNWIREEGFMPSGSIDTTDYFEVDMNDLLELIKVYDVLVRKIVKC